VYWIEGPTGEDVRSAWRGRKLHLQVLMALLHPRTTNLPSLAQCAYVQSAMKIFIRSCVDCSIAEVAEMVGVIRSKLPVFLQVSFIDSIGALVIFMPLRLWILRFKKELQHSVI
jgi:hypothetical protein